MTSLSKMPIEPSIKVIVLAAITGTAKGLQVADVVAASLG
jgi:hypothetical protein